MANCYLVQLISIFLWYKIILTAVKNLEFRFSGIIWHFMGLCESPWDSIKCVWDIIYNFGIHREFF